MSLVFSLKTHRKHKCDKAKPKPPKNRRNNRTSMALDRAIRCGNDSSESSYNTC